MKNPVKITFRCLDNPGPVVTEHLRYMGVLDIGNTPPLLAPPELAHRLSGDYLITVTCPRGHRESVWVQQNLDRLHSSMIRAVAWKGTKIVADNYDNRTQGESK